jgi:uncharacterized surface protein with fasciclin (FAS1) repeats
MKQALILLAGIGVFCAAPAQADNSTVENAIKNRADLSSFYEGLVNTGVIRELKPNTMYTVFAPTNDALSRISQDKYPCFYSVQCKAEIAQIMRNHIVPGEQHLSDVVKQKGGVHSINSYFIRIGEMNPNDFVANGKDIIYTASLAGGMLYKIDGVLASDRQMALLAAPAVVTTTTVRTIPDPACGPAGCPDRVSQTTTITRPIAYSPAR